MNDILERLFLRFVVIYKLSSPFYLTSFEVCDVMKRFPAGRKLQRYARLTPLLTAKAMPTVISNVQ